MTRFEWRVSGRRPPAWSTKVVVAPGALQRAASGIARDFPALRKIVVSDGRVARLYGARFLRLLARHGAKATMLTFPAGERSKTRESKARLEDRLMRSGAGRDTLIVALGGGVTGDLAGFLAATWQRGVPWVAIPTTLLAMVDAGLGGKTAVDVPGGKNLVGAFHQPRALWADLAVLRTLSDRVYRAGLAEAVKTAVALDATLFRRLESDAGPLVARDATAVGRVVARCLALKGRVVAEDEKEQGLRAALNLGHTAAHAIEVASGYRVPHGYAVAMGLVAESRLAERLIGLPHRDADRIEALLRRLGLPVTPPSGLDRNLLAAAMRRDKKSRAGGVRATLPERIGRMPRRDDPTISIDPARDLLPFLAPN